MSIQSSINQMLGNVGLLANTFQFQNQIKKTEEISSRFGRLNKERERLEADKAKYQAEFDEERSKFRKEKNDFEKQAELTKREINELWEGVSSKQPDAHEVDLWGLNPYSVANGMASNVAQQRVDAERENKRKNQFENLQKAFQNIGMGGVNNG